MNTSEIQYLNYVVGIAIALGSWIITAIISLVVTKAVRQVELKNMEEKIRISNEKLKEFEIELRVLKDMIAVEIQKQTKEIKNFLFQDPGGKPLYVRENDCSNTRHDCHKLICGKINEMKGMIYESNKMREEARKEHQEKLDLIFQFMGKMEGKQENAK